MPPPKKPSKDKKQAPAPVSCTEANRLLRMGLVREAIGEYAKLLEQAPEDKAALLGSARAWLAANQPERAREALGRLLAVDPHHAEAGAHLAMLEALAGDDAALGRLEKLAARRRPGFFAPFNLGTVLAERGDLEGARQALQKALEAEPASPFACFKLGSLALKAGQPAEAARHFEKAAELARGDWAPLLMLSRAQAAQGELGRAVKTLGDALGRAPREPGLHEEMFKLCMLAGSPQGAMKAAIALRGLAPENARYAYLHGLATLSVGLLPQARDVFEHALQQAPEAWEIKQALAQTCSLLKDRARATALLEEIVAERPGEPGPVNDLAVEYLSRPGGAERARRVLAPVVEAHPGDAAANLNMALALERSDRSKALEHARRAAEAADERIGQKARKLVERLG